MIRTEIITETEGFRTLREEWNELLQSSSSNCLFLTWEWQYTWWRRLAEDRSLNIIAVRQDERLIALAPLVLRPWRIRRLLPFRVLEFIGSGSVGSDYLSILIRNGHEEAGLQSLAQCLGCNKHGLELNQVESTSFPMINLVLQMRQSGWRAQRHSSGFCPYIDLSGINWEAYLDGLITSHSSYFRKKLRKLHNKYAVQFERTETEVQRQEAMKTLVALHLKRWNMEEGGSNALDKAELQAFHEDFSKLALEQGWLRLFTLKLNGDSAASVYAFNYNGIFYYYQAGFDPDYYKSSVGLINLGLAIKSAIEEEAREYDFLHGDEDYKYLWAREERQLIRLDLIPPKARGELYHQALRLKWSLKRFVRQWSPPTLGPRLSPGRAREGNPESQSSGRNYVTRTD